jgi:hypothetical protein
MDASGFVYWWKIYPRKAGKKAAESSWKRTIKLLQKREDDTGSAWTKDQAETWLEYRVAMFAASPKGGSGKYCPYPATWLNQGRYDDDDAVWQDDDGLSTENGILQYLNRRRN